MKDKSFIVGLCILVVGLLFAGVIYNGNQMQKVALLQSQVRAAQGEQKKAAADAKKAVDAANEARKEAEEAKKTASAPKSVPKPVETVDLGSLKVPKNLNYQDALAAILLSSEDPALQEKIKKFPSLTQTRQGLLKQFGKPPKE